MRKIIICENDNLKENIERLKKLKYKYIIKGQDKFLSGWGYSSSKKHIQLIACKDFKEREIILQDLKNDNTFSYITWYSINDYKGIYGASYGKTYTIRNDWTRCF